MYPYDILLGMDLYEIMLVVGFFAALLFLRFWADRRAFSARLQNLCIVGALVAVVGGYGSAVLTQAFYWYMESGTFRITAGTGATFYGGLIGGAAIFLLIYFVGGRLICPDEYAKNFFALSEIAAGSIAVAHGFGRLGCLFAGCCHGKVTDAWYGIYHVNLGARAVPTQLFEALFLFALCGYLSYRLYKKQKGNLGLYLVLYAIWRFVIEFFRADARGESLIRALTPSQLIAILLLLLGVGLWGLEYLLHKKAGGEVRIDA